MQSAFYFVLLSKVLSELKEASIYVKEYEEYAFFCVPSREKSWWYFSLNIPRRTVNIYQQVTRQWWWYRIAASYVATKLMNILNWTSGDTENLMF